jgi:hypothetical protein
MKKFFIIFAILMILVIINFTYRLYDHENYMRDYWDSIEKSKVGMIGNNNADARNFVKSLG